MKRIKIDLHIHSIASKYKEANNIVDNSTIENIDVLLNKLNENGINLFSITDHNRFNTALYEALDNKIAQNIYPKVKGLVAGVEFDVKLDENMDKCHIITIFDAHNDVNNYKRIETFISANLKGKEDYYSKDEFENLLKQISLSTILIACQRNSIDQHNGGHNSLSESTRDVRKAIAVGYVNALEYQKPNVEGIIKSNLHELAKQTSLITGSDCHDWYVYPHHDKKNQKNFEIEFTQAKILPTFKGLVMAVTAPQTRINGCENRNINYIKEIHQGVEDIKLSNGINAIIGENGAGKSTMLKLLAREDKDIYVKKLLNDSQLSLSDYSNCKIEYISQGYMVSNYVKSNLFKDKGLFKEIDYDLFKSSYKQYADKIYDSIYNNIRYNKLYDDLREQSIDLNYLNDTILHYVKIEITSSFQNLDNEHYEKYNVIYKLSNELNQIINDEYFAKYHDKLEMIKQNIKIVLLAVKEDYLKIDHKNKVKNIIISKIKDYESEIDMLVTSKEKNRLNDLKYKTLFIESIISLIKIQKEDITEISAPSTCNGTSINIENGFRFIRKANYDEKELSDVFLTKMFNKGYTLNKLNSIKSDIEFVEAIRNCTKIENIRSQFYNNLNAFINEQCQYIETIVDESGNKSTGNTLGESSLAYLKYVSRKNDCDVLIIDQPEDNISNNNIVSKLINYLNSIRYDKQLIFVTHNPLLVVNLDVDNVIFVTNTNGKIKVVQGCLESENGGNNMLDIIANNMDGGRESIERRMKIYGKNN